MAGETGNMNGVWKEQSRIGMWKGEERKKS